MINIPVLSSAYFPPVGYFMLLNQHPKVLIDQFEHYPKQSYRNRCQILGANGVQNLSIPIVKKSGLKTALKEVQVDYTTDWIKNHWKTLESAYASSPFFFYYQDELKDILNKKPNFLLDLNQNISLWLIETLNLETELVLSDAFCEDFPEELDFRSGFHPKEQWIVNKPDLTYTEYTQVFSEKFDFIPNLSILDLLFCMGPESEGVLNF